MDSQNQNNIDTAQWQDCVKHGELAGQLRATDISRVLIFVEKPPILVVVALKESKFNSKKYYLKLCQQL
jgi:hypothetical protein